MNSTVRRLAQDVGICVTIRVGTVEMLAEETLEAFSKALLEMAARECEKQFENNYSHSPRLQGAIQCAKAIRAMLE